MYVLLVGLYKRWLDSYKPGAYNRTPGRLVLFGGDVPQDPYRRLRLARDLRTDTPKAKMNYHYVKGSGWVPGDYEYVTRVVHNKKVIVIRKMPTIGDKYYCIKPGESMNIALDGLQWQIEYNENYGVRFDIGGLYTGSEMQQDLLTEYELLTVQIEDV